MRKLLRLTVALGLLAMLSVAQAQVVDDISFDQDILADLVGQPSIAYTLTLDEATTVNMSVNYLGAAFGFMVEIFGSDGSPVAEEAVNNAGGVTLDLPAGDFFVLLAAMPGETGRAIVRFSAGAPTDAPAPPTGAETGADPDPDGPLASGQWRVVYQDDFETNCPDELPLAEALLPEDGSLHGLTFSDPPQALEFHAVVAADQISTLPEFFMTDVLADGVFEVVPGIQTAPYTYVYTVNSAASITLNYTQTLALSDCVATITVELLFEGANGDGMALPPLPEQPDTGAEIGLTGSVVDWQVLGDVIDPMFVDDSQLCATGTGGAGWFFDAPQSFVDQVVSGYGQTLSFGLLQNDADVNTATRVMLVVGNAIILEHTLPPAGTTDLVAYQIPLDETGDWVEIDGIFDPTDPAMFQQLLADVTRVQIDGHTETCLVGPMVGDGVADTGASADGLPSGNVPYYVISPMQDPGDNLPVGCDGYMTALDSGQPFSDDPADNIRASLEPLLMMGSFDVGVADYQNLLGEQGLSVGDITIDDGHARVVIDGSFLLIGTCGDPQIEAQFLLGIFADPRIDSVEVVVNGESLRTIVDMSGQTPPGAAYTRDDIPLRTW